MLGGPSVAALVVAALALVLFPSFAWLSEPSLNHYLAHSTEADQAPHCVEPPLCDSPRLTMWGRCICLMKASPLRSGSSAYQQYAEERVRRLLPHLVRGQFALQPVTAALVRKLAHPTEPLIMHFAGDNGVGKTRTAEAVSLAMGQRCAGRACSLGDSTLVLSGTAFDGLSLGEFRRVIVPAVVQHAKKYPGTGVLIVNELSSLDHDKVKLLLPLLGRGSAFPEHPAVDLSVLTVIITTDFGREGRTQGRTAEEMRALINAEFRELYSQTSTSYIRTFPFLPISLEVALDVAKASVHEMGCTTCGLPVEINEDAAGLLVERVKPLLAVENGRAVALEAMENVGPLVDVMCANSRQGKLAGSFVGVKDDGSFIIMGGP